MNVDVNVTYSNQSNLETIKEIELAINNLEVFALGCERSVYYFIPHENTIYWEHRSGDKRTFNCNSLSDLVIQVKMIYLSHKIFINQSKLLSIMKTVGTGKGYVKVNGSPSEATMKKGARTVQKAITSGIKPAKQIPVKGK